MIVRFLKYGKKNLAKLDLRSKIPLQKCYMDNNSTVWRGDIGR